MLPPCDPSAGEWLISFRQTFTSTRVWIQTSSTLEMLMCGRGGRYIIGGNLAQAKQIPEGGIYLYPCGGHLTAVTRELCFGRSNMKHTLLSSGFIKT